MKCRNCNNDAVYTDGLCEQCEHHKEEQEARVMSDSERINFSGQTINEDGTIYEETKKIHPEKKASHGYIKFGIKNASWRVKLALGFLVFCMAAIIIGVIGLIVQLIPCLLYTSPSPRDS